MATDITLKNAAGASERLSVEEPLMDVVDLVHNALGDDKKRFVIVTQHGGESSGKKATLRADSVLSMREA